jgi:DNA-binding response OmpR family regulator
MSKRYPVARFASKEDAEAAVAALQDRVAELARAAYAKVDWTDTENVHATVNPRFVVVGEAELARSDLAVVRAKLNRLQGPGSAEQPLEEALLRFFLPKISSTLEQIAALMHSDQAPQRSEWMTKGPLGTTLNTNDHSVERNGEWARFEDYGRAWDVLVRLVARYPDRYPVRDLGHDVWNPDGRDLDPDDNLVQHAVSTLRKLLRPLGITVSIARTLGYVLSELKQ